MLFPVQTAQHWSMLVSIPGRNELHAADSGRGKMFAHTDLQYAPYIRTLEKVLDLSEKCITRSPSRLAVTTQPNSFDCGYHVVLNALSIADHVISNGKKDEEGNAIVNLDMKAWTPPLSTPSEVRIYRKELAERAAALPFGGVGVVSAE